MPRKKMFSILTITRGVGENFADDQIKAVDIQGGLSDEEARARLACAGHGIERHLFRGNELPWEPSVRIGAPRKRKAKDDKPQAEKTARTRRTREQNPGTKFDEDGAKAREQGEANGT